MKKVLVSAAALVAMTTIGLAQQAEKNLPMPDRHETVRPATPAHMPSKVSAEYQPYGWTSMIFERAENIVTTSMPFDLGGTVVQGAGQIFNPRTVYSFYNGTVFNESSGFHDFGDNPNGFTDQDYIDQFAGAGAYTIDSVYMFVFQNPADQIPEFPGNAYIFKNTTNLQSSSYKTNGFRVTRTTLNNSKLFERQISVDELAAALDQANNTVFATALIPDQPLEFAAGENAVVLYTQDSAAAFDSNAPDDAEGQRFLGRLEYATGSFDEGAFSDSLAAYKALGVYLLKNGSTQVVTSTWKAGIGYLGGGTLAIVDHNIRFFGSVEIGGSGVKYQFGSDVAGQGLGNVSPNPVRENATVPFSINESSNVALDLFSANGTHVKTLADQRYVKGNYTIDVPVSDLNDGIYLVRMIVGNQVYSTKINVVH